MAYSGLVLPPPPPNGSHTPGPPAYRAPAFAHADAPELDVEDAELLQNLKEQSRRRSRGLPLLPEKLIIPDTAPTASPFSRPTPPSPASVPIVQLPPPAPPVPRARLERKEFERQVKRRLRMEAAEYFGSKPDTWLRAEEALEFLDLLLLERRQFKAECLRLRTVLETKSKRRAGGGKRGEE